MGLRLVGVVVGSTWAVSGELALLQCCQCQQKMPNIYGTYTSYEKPLLKSPDQKVWGYFYLGIYILYLQCKKGSQFGRLNSFLIQYRTVQLNKRRYHDHPMIQCNTLHSNGTQYLPQFLYVWFPCKYAIFVLKITCLNMGRW